MVEEYLFTVFILHKLIYKIVAIFYTCINNNEIPGELSCKDICSYVKITRYLHTPLAIVLNRGTRERSPLLWLQNKLCLSQQKAIKVKWFGISLVFK